MFDPTSALGHLREKKQSSAVLNPGLIGALSTAMNEWSYIFQPQTG